MVGNLSKLSSDFVLRSSVARILEEVRRRGDSAVSFFTKKYDGVSVAPEDFRVKKQAIASSEKRLAPDVKKAVKLAASRIRFFARNEMRNEKAGNFWRVKNPDGVVVGQRTSPVGCAAIYVPGGRYPYPSTVLMAAIPAVVAGVKRVYILTPPSGICDEVLYAAAVSGIDEIYRVGGVQGIAAAAYGTKTIPRADIIAGPGNKYVAEAKRQVFGVVGIDMIAGPSEVAVIADDKAPVEWVVADIASQAEHDPDAVCWLLSDSQRIIREVLRLIPDGYRSQLRIKKFSSVSEACDIINDEIAPEHLELMVSDETGYIKKIRNAGAIFAGYRTPTALGDYCAGPSHVLPTSGAARFSGGLSVKTFLKKTSLVMSGNKTSRRAYLAASTLAGCEGLRWHGLSAGLRLKKEGKKL